MTTDLSIDQFPRTADLGVGTARQPANEPVIGPSRLADTSALSGADIGDGGNAVGARSTMDGMVPEEISGQRLIPSHETPVEPASPAPRAPTLPAPCPSVSVPAPSARARAIRDSRLQILGAVAAIIAQENCTIAAACKRVGVNQSNYTRWRDARAEGGDDALLDGHFRSGRKSAWETYVSPEDEEWIVLWLQNHNCRMGDATTPCRLMAEDPRCPTGLAAFLRIARRMPNSILRRSYVNDQIRSKSKGPRAYQLNSIFNLRTLTEMIDGAEVPITPGDWWELDDMSINQPYWFEIPGAVDSERACTVDGIALARQGLYCLDAASGRWLGHQLVGRPRDAYRAEDILRFLRSLMQEIGKPRRGLVLERGIWKSRRIVGYKVTADRDWLTDPFTRPRMEDEEWEVLVAGIESLGIKVQNCWSPMQKGFIEGGFRWVQTYLSSIPTADIGRHRGEGEAATKALIAAKQGRTHPAARGFWHIEAAHAGAVWAEGFVNRRAKQGRLQIGVPDNNWLASITRSPLQQLTKDDMAVFLPEHRDIKIVGGHILPEYCTQPFPFINPELFAELGNGYRLHIAFDPASPELGAAIWNRETGLANRRNWPLGQFIGWAEYEPPCPRFGTREGDRSMENRKRYLNYHREVFAAIKDGGGESIRKSAARDGQGNAVELTRESTPSTCPSVPVRVRPSQRPQAPAPAPERPRINPELLARQARLARQMFDEE